MDFNVAYPHEKSRVVRTMWNPESTKQIKAEMVGFLVRSLAVWVGSTPPPPPRAPPPPLLGFISDFNWAPRY